MHSEFLTVLQGIGAYYMASFVIFCIVYLVSRFNFNCDKGYHVMKPVFEDSDPLRITDKLLEKAKDSNDALNIISFLENKKSIKILNPRKVYVKHVCIHCGRAERR